MARGIASEVGDTMVNQNGYNCTRTEDGWRFTHHLIAEANVGRAINSKLEYVKFADGDKTNLNPDNIIVVPKKTPTANRTLAKLYAQRADIDGKIKALEADLRAKGKLA